MKNPNGFGSVVKLPGTRRRKYAARITDPVASLIPDEDGIYRQKFKYLGYGATKAEALKILTDYHARTPSGYSDITFSQVWELWSERNLEEDTARFRSYSAAFNRCSLIHDSKMTELRLADLESVMDQNAGASKSTLNNIKIVISACFEWAMQNDVIMKDYSQFLKIRNAKEVVSHKAFSASEIEELWNDSDKFMLPLMYIYTGCRPSELTELSKDNVHLNDNYLYIPKAKTKAGIRMVPIADKVMPFFDRCMSAHSSFLLPCSYSELKDFYRDNIPQHKPHDTRSTFVSLMTSAGVQEVIIQKIVGHSGGNVTRDVYTQLTLQPLLDAVNRI